MQTQLILTVDYDPAMTDPEGLAPAMDRLLETALSTPEILDEYGDPQFGEFFVAPPAALPSRYVLYDFDADELACTNIYDDHQQAADDASECDNVIVVALPIPFFHNEEDEPE